MKSNIIVINGHPDPQSFCAALSDAYIEGASASKAQVRSIDVSKITVNPNLQFGYRKRTELEEDLVESQKLIQWADHLVFVYPTWWGVMPAILKGFIDRVFLPGFAYQYRKNSSMVEKLLTGKSAHLIVTLDTPSWYNKLVYKNAGHHVMKRNILKFCGVSPVRVTDLGPIRGSSDKLRAQWLVKVNQLGSKLA
ncbi:NAD(P)H-dependent oxidoreductase [Paenibacillus thiaminolyticus]|uniref:NAD(P)H-dependent oxidoreductase n=1 Tax=Paenibacillus thiaminolyticus TaxID=49283 RepID=UPI0035A72581